MKTRTRHLKRQPVALGSCTEAKHSFLLASFLVPLTFVNRVIQPRPEIDRSHQRFTFYRAATLQLGRSVAAASNVWD